MENSISKQSEKPQQILIALDQHVKEALADAKMTEDNEKNETFCCSICTSIIFNPCECMECEHCFCTQCMDDWRRRGNEECPTCRKPINGKPLNRILRELLSQITFVGCPLTDCDKNNQIMKYQEIIAHWQKDCPKMDAICSYNCGTTIKREELENHLKECVPFLRQSQKEEEKIDYSTIEVTICENPLKKTLSQTLKNTVEGYKSGWYCNGMEFNGCLAETECDGTQDQYEQHYHCKECQFDYCKSCYERFGNPHIHPLELLTLKEIREVYPDDYDNGWECDEDDRICPTQGKIQSNDYEYLYHDDKDEFDLCQFCAFKFIKR